jgi:hypothetical protein
MWKAVPKSVCSATAQAHPTKKRMNPLACEWASPPEGRDTMRANLGTVDRSLRVVASLVMAGCAVLAPLPLGLRSFGFGGSALYLLFSALVGTCFGYRLMGLSSCPLERK